MYNIDNSLSKSKYKRTLRKIMADGGLMNSLSSLFGAGTGAIGGGAGAIGGGVGNIPSDLIQGIQNFSQINKSLNGIVGQERDNVNNIKNNTYNKVNDFLYNQQSVPVGNKVADGGYLYGIGGSLGSSFASIIDSAVPQDSVSNIVGKSAGKGTVLGLGTGFDIGNAILPGIGGAIGAGVGGLAGGLAGTGLGEAAKRKLLTAIDERNIADANSSSFDNSAQNVINPNQTRGNKYSSYYGALGGKIGDDNNFVKGMKDSNFMNYSENPNSSLFAKGGKLMPLNSIKRKSNLGYINNILSGNYEDGGQMVGEGDNIMSNGRYLTAGIDGGSANQLNSNSFEFNGNSHDEGGMNMKNINAEVEGDETMSGNFVFSNRLGASDIHKKIAKSIGKIEQKPMTPERVNSIRLLRQKEAQLAMAQELMKKLMVNNQF